jgi:hypothetical protein
MVEPHLAALGSSLFSVAWISATEW